MNEYKEKQMALAATKKGMQVSVCLFVLNKKYKITCIVTTPKRRRKHGSFVNSLAVVS
jgi:hypothetical protein